MKIRRILVLFALTVTLPLGAQSFQESLFLNNYRLGFRYNPALQSPAGFLSVGEYSSFSANNVGASSFLYEREGKLVSAFHPLVSSQEFLSSLKEVNTSINYMNYSLFSFGFRTKNAFHTIEVGFRGMEAQSLPKDYFRLLKDGGEDLFSMGGTRLQGRFFAEVAYGYSRKIGDHLTLGVRAKLLAGQYAADYGFQRLDLRISDQSWQMNVQSRLDLTSRSGRMQTDENGYLQLTDWHAKEKWVLPSGAGLALDLGLVWEPADGLQLAASVTDLGGLFWYYGNAGEASGQFVFTGLSDVKMEDINLEGLITQVSDIGESLLKTVALKRVSRRIGWDGLPFQANAGIRYKMPFYKALSLGLMGNYAGYQSLPYWEGRFVVAVNPLPWLDGCFSIGPSSLGLTWGAALQVSVYRFRLHAGVRNGFGGTVPYRSIPLKANAKTLVVGLTYDL